MLDKKNCEKLEKLIEFYKERLYFHAYDIVRDHHSAEDVIQEAFIKISKNLDKIDYVESKRTKYYLHAIVENTAIDFFNKEKRNVTKPLTESVIYVEEIFSFDEEIGDLTFEGNIGELIECLKSSDQEILGLKYNLNLDNESIRVALGLNSDAAVRKRISRARRKLLNLVHGTCGGENDE